MSRKIKNNRKKLCQTKISISRELRKRKIKFQLEETSSANNTKWKWFMRINICCLLKVSCSQYISTFFFHLPPMSQRKKSHSVFLIISDSLIYFVIGSETILQLNKHLFKLKKLKLSWLARTLLFKKKLCIFFLWKWKTFAKWLAWFLQWYSIWLVFLLLIVVFSPLHFVWNVWWITHSEKEFYESRKLAKATRFLL
jgi:hypothetical protein